MGVDFNRISFGISSGLSRNGFGSIVSFPSEAPSFPEAGTILNTLSGTTYIIAEGGASVDISGTNYPTQSCGLYIKADGSGGSYEDWDNVFDVAYKGTGDLIVNQSGTSYVDVNGTYYPNGTYSNDYFHDGAGGYFSNGSNSYTQYGDLITTDSVSGNNSISTPIGSFAYETWTGNEYYHDGNGGYYSSHTGVVTANDGDYIGSDTAGGSLQTEVPSGSGNYFTYHSWSSIEYYFQATGTTYTSAQSGQITASYGDYITYDGFNTYYWDGSGGYYY